MVVWKEEEEEEKASHFTPGKDEEEENAVEIEVVKRGSLKLNLQKSK